LPCLYSSLKAIGNFTTKLFTGYGKKLNLKLFEKSMRTLEEIKRIIAEHKEEIRQKYGIVILGVFGSYARGEQKETSDVDILVELERPVGLEFYEFWDYIENLLRTKADVLTLTALKQKTPFWEKIKGDIVYVS
jgi:predicted nucleotidyltransferase